MAMLIALTVFLVLTGLGCILSGVYLLVGMPWALIAGGLSLIVLAFVAREGLRENG